MNAARLITALELHLRPLIAAEKGILVVAAEVTEAIEALGVRSPDRFGVALVWEGYSGPPDDDLPEAQSNEISVLIRVPTGLPAIPGDALHKEIPGGGYSVLEQVEFVSLLLRRIVFDSDEIESRRMRLLKSGWYRKEEQKTLRIHEMRFELVTFLDVAAETVTVAVPPL